MTVLCVEVDDGIGGGSVPSTRELVAVGGRMTSAMDETNGVFEVSFLEKANSLVTYQHLLRPQELQSVGEKTASVC